MKSNALLGGILIGIGLLILANMYFQLSLDTIPYFIPIALMLIGLIFEFSYFSTKKFPIFLLIAGTFIIMSLYFLIQPITYYGAYGYNLVAIVFALAFGFLQMFIFAHRGSPALAMFFLLAIGGFILYLVNRFIDNFFVYIDLQNLVPFLFIVFGVYLILEGFLSDKIEFS